MVTLAPSFEVHQWPASGIIFKQLLTYALQNVLFQVQEAGKVFLPNGKVYAVKLDSMGNCRCVAARTSACTYCTVASVVCEKCKEIASYM